MKKALHVIKEGQYQSKIEFTASKNCFVFSEGLSEVLKSYTSPPQSCLQGAPSLILHHLSVWTWVVVQNQSRFQPKQNQSFFLRFLPPSLELAEKNLSSSLVRAQ